MAMQVVDLVQDLPVIFSTISSTSCVLGKGLGCTTCLGILALGEKFRFLFTTQLRIYFFCWMVVEVVDACCLVKMVDWVTVLYVGMGGHILSWRDFAGISQCALDKWGFLFTASKHFSISQ